jgi:2-methyl-3-hydroxypyridine 5-carboxylic acid dioxygenase
MHAEIAGAGFAGLVAAIALRERGWTVRVHERTPAIRAEGFGLSAQENMLKVLEVLGVRDEVVRGGQPIRERLVLDASGRTLMKSGGGFGHRISRRHIIAALSCRAEAAGVELCTESKAEAADPAGALRLAGGRCLAADLVVAADGVQSCVRDSLGIPVRRTLRADGAMRVLVPIPPGDIDPSVRDATRESWSGRRRFIVSHTAADELYVAMSCRADDAAGREVPLDVASWSETFPSLRPFFE